MYIYFFFVYFFLFNDVFLSFLSTIFHAPLIPLLRFPFAQENRLAHALWFQHLLSYTNTHIHTHWLEKKKIHCVLYVHIYINPVDIYMVNINRFCIHSLFFLYYFSYLSIEDTSQGSTIVMLYAIFIGCNIDCYSQYKIDRTCV